MQHLISNQENETKFPTRAKGLSHVINGKFPMKFTKLNKPITGGGGERGGHVRDANAPAFG